VSVMATTQQYAVPHYGIIVALFEPSLE
jgi:hypothetical protein